VVLTQEKNGKWKQEGNGKGRRQRPTFAAVEEKLVTYKMRFKIEEITRPSVRVVDSTTTYL